VLTGVLCIRNLVVLVVAINNVFKDGSAFKDTDLLPIGPCIRDGGNSAIGVDLQEPRLFLLIVLYLDRV
jgi:hypothetical protein